MATREINFNAAWEGVQSAGPLVHKAGGAESRFAQGNGSGREGLHHAFILPVLCCLFIAFHGVSGSKPNSVCDA